MNTLATREWLPDPARLPVALLIHGMGGSSQTWYRLAQHLTDLGYRVVAPDLTGHGESPRAERYSVDGWVQDVLSAIEAYPSPQLIVGHSLGGLVATGVAAQLAQAPSRVVLLDPAWFVPGRGLTLTVAKRVLRRMSGLSAASVHRAKPKWSGKDINIVLWGARRWDTSTVHGLQAAEAKRVLRTYLQKKIPTTLVRPVGSVMVLGIRGRLLAKRHGVEVLTMRGVGHDLHRDDWGGLLELVRTRLVPLSAESLLDPTAAG